MNKALPLGSFLDAETLDRRRRAIGWTCRHEQVSIPGMTLIITARAESGELVIAADRRSTVPAGEHEDDGKYVVADDMPKLIDFNGAVIGVAGKCGPALRVIRQFVSEDARDADSCDRMAKRLRLFYEEWHSTERKNWPVTQVTYCDWLDGRGRILRLSSSDGFSPEELDLNLHTSGNGGMAITAFQFFGMGSTVVHAERFCLLSLALTARFYPNVGGTFDVWVLGQNGLSKRTAEETRATLESINESLTGVRARLYP